MERGKYRRFKTYLCQCTQCMRATSVHRDHGTTVQGKYVGKNEFDAHRQLFGIRGADRDRKTSPELDTAVEASPVETASIGPEDKLPSVQVSYEMQFLIVFKERLTERRSHASSSRTFIFAHPPDASSARMDTQEKTQGSSYEINSGMYALKYDVPDNAAALSYEEWLLETFLTLETLKRHTNAEVRLRAAVYFKDVENALMELDDWRAQEWERQCLKTTAQSAVSSPRNKISTDSYMAPVYRNFSPLLLLCYLLAAVLHLLSGLSIDRCGFVLTSLKTLLQISLSMRAPLDSEGEAIISGIPKDIRTVLKTLDVSPVTKSFVCCPKCFACYALAGEIPYPDQCTNRKAPDSDPCGCELRVKRRIKGTLRTFPCRRFIYQDFKHWLGRTLCRPGLEELMDRHINISDDLPGAITDFCDASAIRDLRGPDGQPFINADTQEGRYVFSLNMDGLNPRGKGGPPVSIGAIYLACLNLPLSIRYKEENMYLAAIIPGPHHPSLDEINPLLVPLIGDFRDLWFDGVHYERTPAHDEGRTVRSALIPLLCDLLAARQMAGLAGHRSEEHFCSFCLLHLDEIENLEWKTWKRRDGREHRVIAERWRVAATQRERDEIYKQTGIRWSELLRLPYWDPTKFVAFDPMHGFFLGLFRRHCMEIWGMDTKIEDGLQGVIYDTSNKALTTQEMQDAYQVFRTGTVQMLSALPVEVLRQLCKEQSIRWSGRKGKLQKRLLAHRVERGWFTENGDRIVSLPESSAEIPFMLQRQTAAVEIADASDAVERLARASVGRFSQPVLAAVCVEKLGGALVDYAKLSKRDVLLKLDAYRLDKGIADATGQPTNRIRKPPVTGPVTPSEMVAAEDLLKTGSKTALLKCRRGALVQLCISNTSGKTIGDYEKTNKDALWTALHNIRIKNGFTDASGKVVTTKNIPTDQNRPAEGPVDDAELAKAEDILRHGSKTSLNKLRTAALAALCVATLKLPGTRLESARRGEIAAELHTYRAQHGITDEHGKLLAARGKKQRVLGKKMIHLVWQDMARTVLPSEISAAPSNIGVPGLTPSADEWRSFCTINLPITLIYMWGTKPAESREFKLLHNFMDLVSAIKLATLRTVTKARLTEYRMYMVRYLETLLELFPGVNLSPYQHMSLHLPEVLECLGPAQAIWCFAFERNNYILQQINTNNRIDDLSVTLMNRFCSRQNLRYLLRGLDIPPSIQPILPSFLQSFESDTRGSRLNNILAFQDPYEDILVGSNPGPETRAREHICLGEVQRLGLYARIIAEDGANAPKSIHPFILPLTSITDRDLIYQTSRRNPGNSNIVFTTESCEDWRAGSICDIFTHTRLRKDVQITQTFLVINEFLPLTSAHSTRDPYRQFSISGGRLFYAQHTSTPVILTVKHIKCHHALTSRVLPGTSIECWHVLPLEKW